jgi:hypothetical protein
MWHLSAVRFPLPTTVLLCVTLSGCAIPQAWQAHKQSNIARAQAKTEREQEKENTRLNEQRRLLAVENGDVNSSRGAEIYMPDKGKTFDPNKATAAAAHGYSTGKASTKDFYGNRPLHMDAYQTKDFYGSKANSAAERKYATNDANTKGKFLIPNAGKAADTKTAGTKEAWDANKSAPTRGLADAKRPFLGPESKKMSQPADAKELTNWRNGGESVIYSDGTVERVSNLKQLSVDDIRDLLNKSK